MIYKIISEKQKLTKNKRNRVPMGEFAMLFSSLTKFNIGKEEAISPIEYMKKLISSDEYLATREVLGEINLQQKTNGMRGEEVINHSESTAKNVAFLLLNIKKYQDGKKTAIPINFVLAALLHKVGNLGDLWTHLDIGETRLKKVISIIENYRHNREELEVLLHKNSPKLAIKLYMENSIQSAEELLFYFADAVDTIQSVPKRYIDQKEVVYLQVMAELAEYYELEGFSNEIYSYLFQATEGQQHLSIQEYMINNIALKYGKEFSERKMALEELMKNQIETYYLLLNDMGIDEKDVLITGRIKESFSIAKKIQKIDQEELGKKLKLKPTQLNEFWLFLGSHSLLNSKRELVINSDKTLETIINLYEGEYKDEIINELRSYAFHEGISHIQERNLNEKIHDSIAWRIIFKNEDDMYLFYREFLNRTELSSGTKLLDFEGNQMRKNVLRAYAPKDARLFDFSRGIGIRPTINKNGYQSLHISLQREHIENMPDQFLKDRLIEGELQIRTFKMHYQALTEASHHSYKADEEYGGDETSIEDKFISRKKEIQNKMAVIINGVPIVVPYKGNFGIALYDLYFNYLCQQDDCNPSAIIVNGIKTDKNRIIRNGDSIELKKGTGSISDFLSRLSTHLKLKQQVDLIKSSPVFRDKGDQYSSSGQAIIRHVIKGTPKKYKMTQKKFVDIMNNNYGDKRNILSYEDCQLAVGLGLITEQSLRAHLKI
ncbi:MAG: hypothetical protein A2Y40_03555 [Candidatus Margulisbacteria bacterium GWF2_35_9]|nr:MAG: hypothetical protein A2Y40_03555 [Candidatus Margulisbacteria bacterium GWF2_35_9]